MNQRNGRDEEQQYASIFGVPAERVRPHFWTFSVCFAVTLVFYGFVHLWDAVNPSWQQTPTMIIGDTTRAAAFWALASPILVEGTVMVFASIYRQKQREQAKAEGREEGLIEGREEGLAEGREEGLVEGREEGLVEGRAERDAAWQAWNHRRIEAEAKGLAFTEPPPITTNGSNGAD